MPESRRQERTIRIFNRFVINAVFSLVVLIVAPAPPAFADPTQVTLHLDGTHPVGAQYHQGTFTASPPLCPAGTWLGNGAGSRVFTCSDGSGTFTATFDGELEHVAGLSGAWFIFDGSGNYTTLRGKGVGNVDTNQGGDTPPVTFTDTWTGEVDFDATAPRGAFTAIRLTRPRTSHDRWIVRVVFSAQDNVVGNPVSFHATATAGAFSASRTGTIAGGTGSLSFALHRAMRTHLLRIAIKLSDPWGNTSTIKKNVLLR